MDRRRRRSVAATAAAAVATASAPVAQQPAPLSAAAGKEERRGSSAALLAIPAVAATERCCGVAASGSAAPTAAAELQHRRRLDATPSATAVDVAAAATTWPRRCRCRVEASAQLRQVLRAQPPAALAATRRACGVDGRAPRPEQGQKAHRLQRRSTQLQTPQLPVSTAAATMISQRRPCPCSAALALATPAAVRETVRCCGAAASMAGRRVSRRAGVAAAVTPWRRKGSLALSLAAAAPAAGTGQ
jgi:hypothetical protein